MNSRFLSMLVGIVPFVPFFGILLFLIMRQQKPCPNCGEPLFPFLSPFKKTWRHWIEGGYICLKCGCDVDIVGRKVPAGTAPRLRSVVMGIVLLTMAGVSAALTLSVLLHR